MKQCKFCNRQLPDDAVFCSYCGKRLPLPEAWDRGVASGGIPLESIVKTNVGYYLTQFQKLKAGKSADFNWSAFIFGPMFCCYRNALDLLKWFYLNWIVFTAVSIGIAALIAGISVSNGMWSMLMILPVIWVLCMGYGIYSSIQCGKYFNQEYFKRCKRLAKQSILIERQRGTSMGKVIIAYGLVMVVCLVLGLGISAFSTSALLNWSNGDTQSKPVMITNADHTESQKTQSAETNTVMTEEPPEQPAQTAADSPLAQYIGTWYASTVDPVHNFDLTYYAQMGSDGDDVLGIELQLLEADGTIYAKLREKLETPYSPIRECRSNGDAVLSVVQTGENQWQISFDLVDYNTELLPVIGTGTLELTINPLGELYGEIPQTSGYVLKMGNTKLYAAEEWLNGQYQAYDEENSVLVIPADEEIVDVFECEELLRRYVYGPWVDETLSAAGTIMLESGDWIVTRSGGSLYRNYYYSFSFHDIQEPGVLHTIEVYPDAELYLDGKAYTRTY